MGLHGSEGPVCVCQAVCVPVGECHGYPRVSAHVCMPVRVWGPSGSQGWKGLEPDFPP